VIGSRICITAFCYGVAAGMV